MKTVYPFSYACLLLIAACTAAIPPNTSAGNPVPIEKTPGRLEAVTVYRGQAMVTRQIDINQGAGLHQIVITDLPPQIIPNSLHTESDDLIVRSLNYRVRPVRQDIHQEIRELDKQLQSLHQQLRKNQVRQSTCQAQQQYLRQLETFVAPTATVEISKGVLNAETLIKLSTWSMAQRAELANQILSLEFESNQLQQEIQHLQRERNTIESRASKTAREAIVFIDKKQAAAAKLRVKYLVNHANWTPSYNIRKLSNQDRVVVEYFASVQQSSGENWQHVNMTLSTASPSLIAMAPTLDPLRVRLARTDNTPDQSAELTPQHAQSYRKALISKQNMLDKRRNVDLQQEVQSQPGGFNQSNAFDPSGQQQAVDNDQALNKVAEQLQVLDLVSREQVKQSKRQAHATDQGISVTYQLDGAVTLDSQPNRQLIRIAAIELKAESYKLAIPVLTRYVYDQANIVNRSKMVLLPGPATSYVDGRFVGNGALPMVSIGQSFTVGFGIDTALRASRQLVQRTSHIQGGNRVIDFEYKLIVENFGNQPANVRLVDRLPYMSNGQMKLTLNEKTMTQPLSKDAGYLAEQRPKGMLRWQVEVPAQAIDSQAVNVKYQFNVEFDRQLSIVPDKK